MDAVKALSKKSKERRSKKKLDHYELALAVLNKLGPENVISTPTHTWLWRGKGFWEGLKIGIATENVVQTELVKIAPSVTRGCIDGVTRVLRNHVFRENMVWDTDQEVINFQNGELRFNGKEWQLTPHNRESYLTIQIPHNYDPEAKSESFQRFLNSCFEGDFDGQDKIQLVLEMMGYTMACHARFHAFIMLYGSGSNGKSVILDMVRYIVGTTNVTAVSPSRLDNTFDRAHLHLKLANLVTELSEGEKLADAGLKALTSGDLMTAAYKHCPAFDFQPFATCWFATNHLPYTSDHSGALQRRAYIVRFNKSFKRGVDADPDLVHKLKGEVLGIINMALSAYAEVIKRNGQFTDPASSAEHKRKWESDTNRVEQFVEDMCIKGTDCSATTQELHQAFARWVASSGLTNLGINSFSQRLESLGFRRTRTSSDRAFQGLMLKMPSSSFGLFD